MKYGLWLLPFLCGWSGCARETSQLPSNDQIDAFSEGIDVEAVLTHDGLIGSNMPDGERFPLTANDASIAVELLQRSMRRASSETLIPHSTGLADYMLVLHTANEADLRASLSIHNFRRLRVTLSDQMHEFDDETLRKEFAQLIETIRSQVIGEGVKPLEDWGFSFQEF